MDKRHWGYKIFYIFLLRFLLYCQNSILGLSLNTLQIRHMFLQLILSIVQVRPHRLAPYLNNDWLVKRCAKTVHSIGSYPLLVHREQTTTSLDRITERKTYLNLTPCLQVKDAVIYLIRATTFHDHRPMKRLGFNLLLYYTNIAGVYTGSNL